MSGFLCFCLLMNLSKISLLQLFNAKTNISLSLQIFSTLMQDEVSWNLSTRLLKSCNCDNMTIGLRLQCFKCLIACRRFAWWLFNNKHFDRNRLIISSIVFLLLTPWCSFSMTSIVFLKWPFALPFVNSSKNQILCFYSLNSSGL